MKKSIIVLLIVCIVSIIGFYLLNKSGNSVRKVKIGYVNTSASYPLFIADTLGKFKEQDITIESIRFNSSNELVAALLTGDIDVSPAVTIPVLLKAESINPNIAKLIYMSDVNRTKNYYSFLVKNDSLIKGYKDLEGKKIGVYPGTPTNINLIKRVFVTLGLKEKESSFISLPSGTQLEALGNNSIDALLTVDPSRIKALKELGAREINDFDYKKVFTKFDPFLVAGLSNKFIDTDPLLANKIAHILIDSYQYAEKNKSELYSVISKQHDIKIDYVKEISIEKFIPIDISIINECADYLISIGDLDKKPDLNSLIYTY